MIDGKYLPVCARNTGIYIGVFSSLVYLLISKKYKATTIPIKGISFMLLILLFPLVIDGLGSYLDFYETNNLTRLITGLLFGIVLPIFLVPLIHSTKKKTIEVPVIRTFSELVIPFVLAGILGGITYFSYIPYFVISTVLIVTVICWFTLIWMALFYKINKSILQKIILAACCSFTIITILSLTNKIFRSFYLNLL